MTDETPALPPKLKGRPPAFTQPRYPRQPSIAGNVRKAYERAAHFRMWLIGRARLMEMTEDPNGIVWERYIVAKRDVSTNQDHVMDVILFSSHLGVRLFIQPQTSPYWNAFLCELDDKRRELCK